MAKDIEKVSQADSTLAELNLTPGFSDEILASFDGFSSFSDFAASQGIDVQSVGDLIPSFDVVDKETLIGVPFYMIEWRFNNSKTVIDSQTGEPALFVSVLALLEDGRKVVFNDGSTGIRNQLAYITKQLGRNNSLMADSGLRVSIYPYDNGKQITEARTYYLA